MTRSVRPEQKDELVKALKNGAIAAFPTETVYGLGAVYGDDKALSRLYEAKGRNAAKAITLMLYGVDELGEYAEVDEKILRLARTFMPGRLTLVMRRRDTVPAARVGGLDTIGIRIPDSDFVLSLLKETGPMWVTSANVSGGANTRTDQEVLDQLDGKIDYVVEGHTDSSVASTVADVSGDDLIILREGVLSEDELRRVYDEDCDCV